MPVPTDAFPIFLLSCAAASALAAAGYAALRLPARSRAATLLILCGLILLTPLPIPSSAKLLRMIGAVLAVTFSVKLYDLHVGARAGVLPTFAEIVPFMGNIYSLVHRTSRDLPRRPIGTELGAGARALLLFLPALTLIVAVFRADWSRRPFALEHAAKVTSIFLVLVPLSALGFAGWRLLGGRGIAFMDNPFAARTPADFWRRYNCPTHEFFQEDLFKPLTAAQPAGRRRGRAAVLRATIAIFAVSAAVHEYVFAVAIGRVQCYQVAFFLAQGLAVAATLRVKPRGWKAAPWVAATFTFNVAAAVLFFASVNHVLPLYQHVPPLWAE